MRKALPYFLGCPAWSIAEWKGNFLPSGTAQSDFLKEYSRVFNTVEGNSFFYALPKLEVIQKWVRQSVEGFEFCMKVPRDISHARSLCASRGVYEQLIERLSILAEGGRLGATFLQLHQSFGPTRIDELARFLENWPNQFPLAVEVRHLAFFEGRPDELLLNELLSDHSVDRVIFDSRALFQAPPSDPVEEKSQGRKPRLPVDWYRTGDRPMVRFVGRNDIDRVDPWQEEVARVVADWIREGKRPYVFMHTPDDTFAPQLCLRFHHKLHKLLPDLTDIRMPTCATQIELFD